MSYIAQAWARNVRTGSPTLKSVLLAIANYADEEGVSWPSQARLAFDTELSERSIVRAVQDLAAAGHLTIEHRSSLKGRLSNLIKLSMPQSDTVTVSRGDRRSGTRPLTDRESARKVTESHVLTDSVSDKPFIEPSEEGSKRTGKRVGSRLPDDWSPNSDLLKFGLSEGLNSDEIIRASEEFSDYWRGVTGQKGTKLDWDATFRNRLREVGDRKRMRQGKTNGKPKSDINGALDRLDRRLQSHFGGEAAPANARVLSIGGPERRGHGNGSNDPDAEPLPGGGRASGL